MFYRIFIIKFNKINNADKKRTKVVEIFFQFLDTNYNNSIFIILSYNKICNDLDLII